jgi:hypothetical protein
MDEAVINGAQIIYPKQFGIGSKSRTSFDCFFFLFFAFLFSVEHDTWLVGLVNSAPYMFVFLLVVVLSLIPFVTGAALSSAVG